MKRIIEKDGWVCDMTKRKGFDKKNQWTITMIKGWVPGYCIKCPFQQLSRCKFYKAMFCPFVTKEINATKGISK